MQQLQLTGVCCLSASFFFLFFFVHYFLSLLVVSCRVCVHYIHFFMLCSPVQQPLYNLTWKFFLYYNRYLFLPLFVSFSFIPCLIPFPHFWVWLYFITIFLQRLYTFNQHLALGFVHGIHCGSAIFLYQAFERRRAWGGLISCLELHNAKKFSGIENSFCIVKYFLLNFQNFWFYTSNVFNGFLY
jgi:hypothetical protein